MHYTKHTSDMSWVSVFPTRAYIDGESGDVQHDVGSAVSLYKMVAGLDAPQSAQGAQEGFHISASAIGILTSTSQATCICMRS